MGHVGRNRNQHIQPLHGERIRYVQEFNHDRHQQREGRADRETGFSFGSLRYVGGPQKATHPTPTMINAEG